MKELLLDAAGKNALGTELMQSLRSRLRDAEAEPLLVTGAGDAFCAGLNLKEVRSFDADSARTFIELLETLVTELYAYPGPTVALVNGHAIAGGCVIAMCCDQRVMQAGTGARIGLNETALGLPFPPRVLALAQRRLPQQHRDRILLGAELFDAATALELGLVDEVTQDAERLARERLAELERHPARGYRLNKRALRDGVLEPTPAAQGAFDRDALPVWFSDEVKQMIDGLLERLRRGRS